MTRFLEELLHLQVPTLTTAHTYLTAIAATYRLDGHPDPTERPLARATLKRLTMERGRPQREKTAERRGLMALVQVMRDGLLRRPPRHRQAWEVSSRGTQ